MTFAAILALILVYMVMASQFESLRDPFIILFSIPLALIGIVLMLLLTDTTFNIQGFLGLIVLLGIVVNNAIVLLDYTNQLRREHNCALREAVITAGKRRLRPILMTTITTILGLVPMALGLGEGGELQAPMARVIIGGAYDLHSHYPCVYPRHLHDAGAAGRSSRATAGRRWWPRTGRIDGRLNVSRRMILACCVVVVGEIVASGYQPAAGASTFGRSDLMRAARRKKNERRDIEYPPRMAHPETEGLGLGVFRPCAPLLFFGDVDDSLVARGQAEFLARDSLDFAAIGAEVFDQTFDGGIFP